jgi:hypothetical protein
MNRRNRPANSRRRFPLSQVRLSRLREPDWELDNRCAGSQSHPCKVLIQRGALARILLLLARYGKEDQPERVLQKVSQETLAEMIGTTRSRANLFMNKFKKLGFIELRAFRSPFLENIARDFVFPYPTAFGSRQNALFHGDNIALRRAAQGNSTLV